MVLEEANEIMKSPLVSVIIPVYNAEQYFEECLESVMSQTYQNLEIICIDDCSADSSKEIIRKYQRIDGRVVLLEHGRNEGVSRSRNDGLAFAHGVYISCVDADDKVDRDFIKELVTGIGDSDICVCGYVKFNQEKKKQFLLQHDQADSYEKVMFNILCANYLGAYMCNKLFRKKLMQGIYIDEDLSVGEDLLFVVRYLQTGKRISYVNKPLYQYRIHSKSALHNLGEAAKMNWNKLSNIAAAERTQLLLKEENEYIKDCCSYKVVKSSLWAFVCMIICKEKNDEIMSMIKRKIKNNYKGYKRISYGGSLQHAAVFLTMISPHAVWWLGKIANGFFRKYLKRDLLCGLISK